MKRIILSLLVALPLAAQQPKTDAEVVKRVTEATERAVTEDRFSGVVAVAKDGTPLVQRAWGMADASKNIPNRIDTKFNLGSINKAFTKVAILQLAAAGKLALGDTVRKHLPDYPSPNADRITIEQLLAHRSGLGDFFLSPKYAAAPPSSLRKLSDYLPLFASEPLLFEPGTSQKYSNAGFVVLGLIIEKLSGQTYYDYVRDHIFRPAGMKDTASYAIDENVPNRAIGRTKRGPTGPVAEWRPNTSTLPGRGTSAGGGYSTAADLLRFGRALFADQLLPHRWTNWLIHGDFDNEGPRSYGIAGGAPGISAALDIAPPYAIVTLANQDPPAAEQLIGELRTAVGLRPLERGAGTGPAGVLIAGRTELPLTFSRHFALVEAKVNGKGPYHFVVDTGFAGALQMRADLLKELALPTVGEVQVGDPSGKNRRTLRLTRADSVDLGEVHFAGVQIAESEAARLVNGADGVIGLPLFQTLLVTIDYPQKKLILDGGTLTDGIVYSTERGGVPAIDIEVAGNKLKADLDSGSPGELSVPLAFGKTLTLSGEPQVVGHARTPANEFDIYDATLQGEARIAPGMVLVNPRLELVEILPAGAANLGARFLGRQPVTFDPANHRVRFGPSN
jgi:CubicO group peptidase (beta-lactamase class C family)